ncbi:NAD(P)/FAD-dependent oxidoreductase [Massilia cavernae]|uniref:FAD-binding oxidoreductase n=1 Tax=Massilia cavernae TaxID=2320864 RepID=A0A418XAK7_9BURK|nr:FAD-binding oxidoreductase [Massilia cavernae]RJG09510.1 FAD-binding oxidoreductase [Massilia cavernae]
MSIQNTIPSDAADVIIIGGGIMGASAALFLRERGRSVILLERGLVGQQASGVNFGNVRRQGRYLVQLPLSNRSYGIWRRLSSLVGEDCEMIHAGHLRVCIRPEQAAKVEAYALEAKAYGLDLELLNSTTLRQKFPYIGREAVLGSYSPLDGHANPRLVAPAFGRAARRAGARVEENTEVLSIVKTGEDFHVSTRGGAGFRAPTLLITAGAWAGSMAASLGEPVPLVARGPQMGVTEPLPYRILPSLSHSSPHEHETVYCRQVTRGNIVFGGGQRNEVDLVRVRAYPNPESTLNQMPQLQRLLPGLANVRIIRTWSGIESYLPDDLPVMGPSGKMPGLYYAFGFCGAGFQLGPGVGDVMAELIDTGATTTPIESFSITRFSVERSHV